MGSYAAFMGPKMAQVVKRALTKMAQNPFLRQNPSPISPVSRDNLDENGERRSECEAAAGSGKIIFPGVAVRKYFLRGAIHDHVRPSNG